MTNNIENPVRHDIENIPMGVIIIVEGERFTRKGRWFDESLPSLDFARVDGGYMATAEQLRRPGFRLA